MSPNLAAFLLINIFISVLIGGIIFINLGYRFNRKLSLIKTGWIIIGVLSLLTTIGFAYLMWMTGFVLVFLIFVLPFIILIGLVITLTLGISYIAMGFSKHLRDKITLGFVLLGINLAVLTTFVVLLVMFMTGIIPIRLM